jgi:hypothetical protein
MAERVEAQTKPLDRFRPHWAKASSWLSVTKAKQADILSCGIWFHEVVLEHLLAERKRRIHRRYPDEYRPTERMQGHNVGISAVNGKFILRW